METLKDFSSPLGNGVNWLFGPNRDTTFLPPIILYFVLLLADDPDPNVNPNGDAIFN